MSIGFPSYGPDVEALQHVPAQAQTARETLVPASSPRGLLVRAMRHLCNPERVSRQLTIPDRSERRLSRVLP